MQLEKLNREKVEDIFIYFATLIKSEKIVSRIELEDYDYLLRAFEEGKQHLQGEDITDYILKKIQQVKEIRRKEIEEASQQQRKRQR